MGGCTCTSSRLLRFSLTSHIRIHAFTIEKAQGGPYERAVPTWVLTNSTFLSSVGTSVNCITQSANALTRWSVNKSMKNLQREEEVIERSFFASILSKFVYCFWKHIQRSQSLLSCSQNLPLSTNSRLKKYCIFTSSHVSWQRKPFVTCHNLSTRFMDPAKQFRDIPASRNIS